MTAPLIWVSRVLNEAVMGLLALVALAAAVAPLVFDIAPATDRLLSSVEWAILALFVLEFGVQLAAAADRTAWLGSPWRIVDAICIGGPLLSLLPQVSDTVRGALVFRLLRVGRAVAFGARAGVLVVQKRQPVSAAQQDGETSVTVVAEELPRHAADSSWPELLAWARDRTPHWYHASNVTRARLNELAAAAGVPEHDLADLFEPSAAPRAKRLGELTSVGFWLPTVAESGFPAVTRTRIVALLSGSGLATLSSRPFDLVAHFPAEASGHDNLPFAVRTLYGLLALVRNRLQFVAHRHEEEILRLEEIRAAQGGAQFLNQAFRLQRELSTATADVWRFRALIRRMAEGKPALVGGDARQDPFLENLLVSSGNVHDHFVELKESLKSLMELHMNVTSFEMNKFMKLLAIVGFLGLIPSVAGGLLGMNVEGNPWAVTLGQVAFGIAMAMAVSLYVFAIKGWLR